MAVTFPGAQVTMGRLLVTLVEGDLPIHTHKLRRVTTTWYQKFICWNFLGKAYIKGTMGLGSRSWLREWLLIAAWPA